jgi:DNA invertase Pin-like site-specific DNA recombinase
VIIVWRLDRWGRSLADLIVSLKELTEIGVGFVSLTETLDLTTPSGRAMAGMIAVFAEFERDILRERVKAGIVHARAEGKPHGRPATASTKLVDVKKLHEKGLNNSEISRELKISRRSVIRLIIEIEQTKTAKAIEQGIEAFEKGEFKPARKALTKLKTKIKPKRLSKK